MNLQTVRNAINKIDAGIVTLIAKRQSYMPAIGMHKRKHNMSINQKDREMAILDDVRKMGKAKGLSEDLVSKIFKMILNDGKRIQREEVKKQVRLEDRGRDELKSHKNNTKRREN